jgi:hypothetical protein
VAPPVRQPLLVPPATDRSSMHPRPTLKFLLLLALGLTLLAMLATAASAATPWGEITHFGDKTGELGTTQPAFGVNPEDGTVWVGDETVVGGEPMLRIQKFKDEGGSWKAVSSDDFSLTERVVGKEETTFSIKGIAFDAELHRAYVLLEEQNLKGEEPNTAAQLWEFSTNTPQIEGSVLVDRSETEYTNPAGQTKFDPQGKVAGGGVLSEPSGIAVDPKTHDVLITGTVLARETASIWAISSTGKIESEWKDGGSSGKSFYFEEGSELASPVVTSTGHILVLGNTSTNEIEGEDPEKIYEMPESLSSSQTPKSVFTEPTEIFCKEAQQPCSYVEKLTQFGTPEDARGSRLAIGPEGNVYVHVKIKVASGSKEGGVMVLTPALQEVGWTGGGSWSTESSACAVAEGFGPASLISAGKEAVFMFEVGQQGRDVSILELGSGGSTTGCPATTAKIKATAGGLPVEESVHVPITNEVTFESTLENGNSVSTTWEPEPGVEKKIEKREQEHPKLTYKFLKPGKHVVKETIQTDNLATPTITSQVLVDIAGPVIQKPEAVVEGSAKATLKAEIAPGWETVTACEFQWEKASGGTKASKTCSVGGNEETFVKEAVPAEGLEPATKYKGKVIAKSARATSEATFEWETPAEGAPTATTEPATAITSTEATLNAKVNPAGKSTTCEFQWGETTEYKGGSVPCSGSPLNGSTTQEVHGSITGLTAGKTYHFRVVANNGVEAKGVDRSFATPEGAKAPVVTTSPATLTATTGGTMNGIVNPEGSKVTECYFEYGTATASGTKVACPTPVGEGRSGVAEAVALTGLTPGTSYHYKLVAVNGVGKAEGAEQVLTTSKASTGGGGNTGGGGSSGGGGGVVLGNGPTSNEPAPIVTVSGVALTVASSGSFSLKLSCPAGESSCTGTVIVKTASAVAATAAKKKAKKAILTLASGSFTIVGGKLKAITLHLSSKAKALLAKLHTVKARATIAAHNPQGTTHSTTVSLTLKAAKKKH